MLACGGGWCRRGIRTKAYAQTVPQLNGNGGADRLWKKRNLGGEICQEEEELVLKMERSKKTRRDVREEVDISTLGALRERA